MSGERVGENNNVELPNASTDGGNLHGLWPSCAVGSGSSCGAGLAVTPRTGI